MNRTESLDRILRRERKNWRQRHQCDIAMLKKWLAICDNWPHGPTFPGLRDGDKKAEEFVAVVRRMVAEEDVDGSPQE